MVWRKLAIFVLLFGMLASLMPNAAFAEEGEFLPEEILVVEELPPEEFESDPEPQQDAPQMPEEVPEALEEPAAALSAEVLPEEELEELPRAAAVLNDEPYLTLQEAVDAAGDGDAVIYLIEYAEEEVTVGRDQHITLDLNGGLFSGKISNFGELTIVGEGAFTGRLSTKAYQVKNEYGETVEFASGRTVIQAESASFQASLTVEQENSLRLDGDRKMPGLSLRAGSFFGSTFDVGYGYQDEYGEDRLIPDDAAGFIAATGGVYSSIPDGYIAEGYEAVWYDWGVVVALKQIQVLEELPEIEELIPEEDITPAEEEFVLEEAEAYAEVPEVTEEYTISYELNGGSFQDSPKETYTSEEEVIYPDPEKEGASFGGWYVEQDFSGVKRTGISKGSTGDVTVYAKWNVTVTLDAASTSSSVGQVRYAGEPIARGGSVTVTQGQDVELEIVSVQEGQVLSRLALDGKDVEPVPVKKYTIRKIEKDTVVLAEFKQGVEYTVVFKNNGKEEKSFRVFEGESVEAPQPGEIPADQTFLGWVNDTDEKDVLQPKDELTVRKSVSYSAKFSKVTLRTVTYDAAGGSCPVEKQTVEDGDPVTLPAALRAGFRFKGWLSSLDGALYQAGMEYTPAADTLFTAQWLEEYRISYILDGGMLPVTVPNPTIYTAESEAITYPTPAKFQHNFMGWYTSPEFAGIPVNSQPKGTTGNITLYAKWQKIPEIFRVYVYHNTFGTVSFLGGQIPSGDYFEVEEGSSVTLYFNPNDSRYYVYNCTLNGDKQGSISALTIENITSNQTVVVSFMPTIARPMTGDNSNLGLWIGLMALSAAVVAAVLIVRRKKK